MSTHRTLTMHEAAKELRKSRRWLQTWLSLHPLDAAGIPYYAPFGRTKTFDDNDLARIRAAVREEERCRLSSLTPVRAKRRTIRAAAHTSGDMLTEARNLVKNRYAKPRSVHACVGHPQASREQLRLQDQASEGLARQDRYRLALAGAGLPHIQGRSDDR